MFDQKKFKKKDQGFLGVINVQVSNVFDLAVGGDGKIHDEFVYIWFFLLSLYCRNADTRLEKIKQP